MGYWDKQPASRVLLNQSLAWVGATITSSFFSKETFQIRVISQIAGTFRISDNTSTGTLATSGVDMLIPASTVGGEYFQVVPGQFCSFCSSSTSSGIIAITEMA